jgi:ABC-type uncharacterized transport system substrate-binding protein
MNSPATALQKCLWVSSYAPGYEWNDGIGKSLHATLDKKCDMQEFHMDTKQNKSIEFAQQQAIKAKSLISEMKPDIIIASDDNAAKFLIVPYLKETKIPIVVCGINWSAREYGFPATNVTGIIEVFPVAPLLHTVKEILSFHNSHKGRALLITGDTRTGHKNYEFLKKRFKINNIQLEGQFANTFAQWKNFFLQGNDYDFIVLVNKSGIKGWEKTQAADFVNKHKKQLIVTFNHWMLPYSMIAFTKIAEEQGEWAGNMALAILDGYSPGQIPMTANQRWNEYINTELLKDTNIHLPIKMQDQAIKKL